VITLGSILESLWKINVLSLLELSVTTTCVQTYHLGTLVILPLQWRLKVILPLFFQLGDFTLTLLV
jgi:hypothetical protein